MFLTAVIDWYSRFVLSWRLSNSARRPVLPGGVGGGVGRRESPEIFNTDQGVQYTARSFTGGVRLRLRMGSPSGNLVL